MVQAEMRVRRAFAALIIALLPLCLQAGDGSLDWGRVPVDASRTGVGIPSAHDVSGAVGTVSGKKYLSPCGKTFKGGSTAAVAALMIQAQPAMSSMKEVLCTSEAPYESHRPQSELSSFIVDRIMEAAAQLTGRRIDVGITNFGGIRTTMPQGDVLLDDIVSMLPFKNYVCYVELPGRELRRTLERMAANRVEVLGGVEAVIRDRKLVSVKVGGQPLDDSAMYGLATIDFLLEGGDGLTLAMNASKLIVTEMLVRDAVIPYLRSLGAEGTPFSYGAGNRVTILNP